jgi:hypothetical protein
MDALLSGNKKFLLGLASVASLTLIALFTSVDPYVIAGLISATAGGAGVTEAILDHARLKAGQTTEATHAQDE